MGDPQPSFLIVLIELAPGSHRRLEHTKIARADEDLARTKRLARDGRPAVDGECEVEADVRDRHLRAEGQILNAGNRTKAIAKSGTGQPAWPCVYVTGSFFRIAGNRQG